MNAKIMTCAVATIMAISMSAHAGIVANITAVNADGAPPKAVTSGADVSGHVLVVSGYMFDTMTGKAPTEAVQLLLSSSGQAFSAKPYSSGYNEEAYLAMYDLNQMRPAADVTANLNSAGWVYLLDTTAIPSGTYTIGSIQVGDSINPQIVQLTRRSHSRCSRAVTPPRRRSRRLRRIMAISS